MLFIYVIHDYCDHPNQNYGKAEAVKEGIKHINSDYTLLIDSDLEYSPNDAHEI